MTSTYFSNTQNKVNESTAKCISKKQLFISRKDHAVLRPSADESQMKRERMNIAWVLPRAPRVQAGENINSLRGNINLSTEA